MPRFPGQGGAQRAAVGDQLRRIAGTPGRAGGVHRCRRHLFDGGDHFAYRIAMPIAAIEQHTVAAAEQMAHDMDMGVSQIGNMNIVADAGTVGRVVILAVDLHLGPPSGHHFRRQKWLE